MAGAENAATIPTSPTPPSRIDLAIMRRKRIRFPQGLFAEQRTEGQFVTLVQA